jgi:hypothetical protein
MKKPLTTEQILTIQKTNEVYTFLDEMWSKVFRYEMDCSQSGTIPPAMGDLRKAIEAAQEYVLMNTKGITIKP